jgi:hypothetical protein
MEAEWAPDAQLFEIGYDRREAARRISKELANLRAPGAIADWLRLFGSRRVR